MACARVRRDRHAFRDARHRERSKRWRCSRKAAPSRQPIAPPSSNSMVDDVDAEFARLKDKVEVVHEPKMMPWGNRAAQFRDPVSLFTPYRRANAVRVDRRAHSASRHASAPVIVGAGIAATTRLSRWGRAVGFLLRDTRPGLPHRSAAGRSARRLKTHAHLAADSGAATSSSDLRSALMAYSQAMTAAANIRQAAKT